MPAAVGAPNSRLWGTIAAAYPCGTLDVADPKLTATFETMWTNRIWDLYRFEDQPDKIWTYITADWAIALLRRGEWQRATTLFAGYRKIASAVFGWWEEYFTPTGIGTGDDPHGWAAANYVLWLRTLVVDEMANGDLALLGGVPPDWYVVGKPIDIRDLPTERGLLRHLRVVTDSTGARAIDIEFVPHAGLTPKLHLYARGFATVAAQCSEVPSVLGDRTTVSALAVKCTLSPGK